MKNLLLHLGTKVLLVSSAIVSTVFSVAPSLAQSVQNPPIFDSVTLDPNFSPDPRVLRGVSGGSIPASHRSIGNGLETPTGPCVGFVDQQPDHTMTLTAFFPSLKVSVESHADTTLVIRGPGGTWCNDDANDSKNPAIAGQWQAGRYLIWVGSYNENRYYPYIMRITQQD